MNDSLFGHSDGRIDIDSGVPYPPPLIHDGETAETIAREYAQSEIERQRELDVEWNLRRENRTIDEIFYTEPGSREKTGY